MEMHISREDLWTESIFYIQVPEVDNQGIIDFAFDKKKVEPGTNRSNYGGWQYDITKGQCEALDDMFMKMEHAVNHVFNDVFKAQIDIGLANAWLNWNERGNTNTVHTHPGSLYSGVYYITGNGSIEMGSISFVRENAHSVENIFTGELRDYHDRDPTFICDKHIPPSESTGIIFSPWLQHEVTPNMTDEPRIVVGMNFNVRQ
jgi:uncharacterized protein (TIGR02466 family)